jgi:hypothetical protein
VSRAFSPLGERNPIVWCQRFNIHEEFDTWRAVNGTETFLSELRIQEKSPMKSDRRATFFPVGDVTRGWLHLSGTGLAPAITVGGVGMMSRVRLLGFATLGCGCVTGRYREVATRREITYVEEKGVACTQHGHRRNHTLAPSRFGTEGLTARAS